MIVALAAIPLLAALLLRVGARPLADRLSPATATWLLTATTLSVSLTCGLVLTAASYVSLAQLSAVASLGHWSPAVVRGGPDTLPVPVGAALAALVLALLSAAVLRTGATVRAFLAARATIARLPRSQTSLVVVDDPVPSAFAVAGRTGRIVVSAGMLGALTTDERRVLLAHEEAHLRYRHHLFAWVTAIAAAANPLLRNNIALVRASIERWADESAVREVGDRALVARGLARAAVVRAGAQTVSGTVGIADGDVVARVQALLAPPPAPRRMLAWLLAAGVLASWIAALLFVHDAHAVIEVGESAYRH